MGLSTEFNNLNTNLNNTANSQYSTVNSYTALYIIADFSITPQMGQLL